MQANERGSMTGVWSGWPGGEHVAGGGGGLNGRGLGCRRRGDLVAAAAGCGALDVGEKVINKGLGLG